MMYFHCATVTALEELMCRILQEGSVAKLADDLFCGGDTLDEVWRNCGRVLEALKKSDIRLSFSPLEVLLNGNIVVVRGLAFCKHQ
jgi:hypothetical protein